MDKIESRYRIINQSFHQDHGDYSSLIKQVRQMSLRLHAGMGVELPTSRRKKALYYAFLVLVIPILIFSVLDRLCPLPVEKLNRPPSVAVFSENGSLLNVYLADDDQWRIPATLDDIPAFMRNSVISYEDRWFSYHPGFNPFSILRAMFTDIKQGKVVCGGSTITMQVARMMEPKQRTLRAKLFELFRAIQLEIIFSKDEILEHYFNLAPYGGNIVGIAAASYFYFGKSPAVLSKGECLALVGLPNSPSRLRPDRHHQQSTKHRDRIAALLLERELIDENEYRELISDSLPRGKINSPHRAPHFSRLVKNIYTDQARIKSSLDLRIQTLCEKALRQHLLPLLPSGVTNGAVVVIDNENRSVRAMVGSRDFFDSAHSGQVNGTLASRSPGSAMKPFLYALALDEGIISPRSLLNDVPVSYSGYSPVNYDGTYSGGVSAENALKLSLNVPAINLHASLWKQFYPLLLDGGISTLRKPKELYGLPLVLGGAGVNLLELTNLYATFAAGGWYRKYRLSDHKSLEQPRRLFSDASSYIISEILSEVRRPDLPNCWEFSADIPKIAWKTGTSYGHRDAWSIGYDKQYTVGVWLGNFSGKEARALVGSETAAPLLFDIFHALTGESRWFKQPANVGTRKVCALSGMVRSDACPQSIDELYIFGVTPFAKCDMHRSFAVDDLTGLRLSPDCRYGKSYTEKTFVLWPPKIATWRSRQGYPIDEIPPYSKDCRLVTDRSGPAILSPEDEAVLQLRDDRPREHQKILLDASTSNTSGTLFWFIDGELFTSCNNQERRFFSPSPGKHRIVCMDYEGRSSGVDIYVY